MNKIKQALLKFQALTLRERLMAVAATLVVLYFLIDFALLAPQNKSAKALQQQIAQQKIELDAMTKVMAAAVASQPVDGLVNERAERDALLATVAQVDPLLGQVVNSAPLGEVLRSMIAARPDLTLVSLKTLPAEVFYKPVAAAPDMKSNAALSNAAPQLTLYKHGVEVGIKGKYPALLAYLQNLQRNPNPIFWASVKLDVVNYPEETLRMTIYTLSNLVESPLG